MLALALLIAGCTGKHAPAPKTSLAYPGSATASAAVAGEPPLGPILTSDQTRDKEDFPLPLDAYRPTRQDELTMDQAVDKVEVACLRRFGFQPDFPPRQLNNTRTQVHPTARLFGEQVQAVIDRYGYHPPPDPNEVDHEAGTAQIMAKYPQVMWDVDSGDVGTSYAGQKVPAGGCNGEAWRTVFGAQNYDRDPAGGLNADAYERARQDTRLKAALVVWSKCMAAAGYHYPPVALAAWNDKKFLTPDPTPLEIATAKADLACQRKQNLVGLWYALDVAYQNVLIEQKAAWLNEIKQRNDALVRKATEILGR